MNFCANPAVIKCVIAKIWIASGPGIRPLGAYSCPILTRVITAGSVPATVGRKHSGQAELEVRIHV